MGIFDSTVRVNELLIKHGQAPVQDTEKLYDFILRFMDAVLDELGIGDKNETENVPESERARDRDVSQEGG